MCQSFTVFFCSINLLAVALGYVILPDEYYPLEKLHSNPPEAPSVPNGRHSSVITSIVSNVTTGGRTTASNTTTSIGDLAAAAPPAPTPAPQNSTVDDVTREMFLKLKLKVKDKNARDMFMVSKYLQGSVRGALLGAIKKSLGVLDPKVVKGIDSSLHESFSNMQKEAVHVGPEDSNETKEILLQIPL